MSIKILIGLLDTLLLALPSVLGIRQDIVNLRDQLKHRHETGEVMTLEDIDLIADEIQDVNDRIQAR